MKPETTQNSVSYFEVLQVSPQSSDEDVKRAYRKLAMRFHPDRNPGDRQKYEHHFRLINEAYAHLKTREKRRYYWRKNQAGNDNHARRSLVHQIFQTFWSR